jgi:predicted ATPase/transcriptional regulator with XRE-family HTH domain
MAATVDHSAKQDASEPFAQILRRLRRAAGLTQEQLAEAAGVSTRTVSDLERGLRRTPQEGSGELLAAALGLTGVEREGFFAAIRHQRLSHRPPVIGRSAVPGGSGPILGRDAVLVEVERRIEAGARIVTLAGTGGVGKTTIAREVARRRQHAGGLVVWVPLEAVEHPSDVLPAIMRAAAIPERPGASLPRRLADAIGQRRVLLVLDNLEHLIDAAPEIAELLALAPTLSVIATSRETIRIAGEDVLPIEPLPIPPPVLPGRAADPSALAANPAVALFLRSAGARDPDADALSAAARIVTLMDGLPLAIELAAAQVGIVPVSGLAMLLEHGAIEALALGRRDGPARFASMEAALAWSESRLPAEARRLLRLLGVFRGGFSPEAVRAVAANAGAPGLERGLLLLASAQLIRPVPGVPGRFRMLEPVRMFAASRLRAAGEEDAVRAAHARWMLYWARRQDGEIFGPDPQASLDAVERDLPNLRAALAAPGAEMERALETVCLLQPFWEYRGYQREVVAILESVIAAAEDTPAASSPWFLWSVFWTARFSQAIGQFGQARAWTERFERLAASSGQPAVGAFAIGLRWSDRFHREAPDGDEERQLRDALETMPPDALEIARWGIAALLGRILLARGDAAEAVPMLREADRLARMTGARIIQPEAQGMLGLALLDWGDPEAARTLFDASLETCLELGLVMPALAAMTGRLELAAAAPEAAGASTVLLGAVEGLLERVALAHDRFWTGRIAAIRLRLAAAIHPETMQVLAEDGRDLPLPEAIALALTLPGPGSVKAPRT